MTLKILLCYNVLHSLWLLVASFPRSLNMKWSLLRLVFSLGCCWRTARRLWNTEMKSASLFRSPQTAVKSKVIFRSSRGWKSSITFSSCDQEICCRVCTLLLITLEGLVVPRLFLLFQISILSCLFVKVNGREVIFSRVEQAAKEGRTSEKNGLCHRPSAGSTTRQHLSRSIPR